MKKLALDSRGISHLLVPLLIILVVAIGGTYMLVSSHADSISKAKPHLKFTQFALTTNRLDATIQVVDAKGVSVSQANCSGSASFGIKAAGSSTSEGWSGYAHWENNACVLTAHQDGRKPGRYKFVVLYYGNSHYRAVSKSVTKSIKKPKVDNSVTSSGDSLGGTVVAPAQ